MLRGGQEGGRQRGGKGQRQRQPCVTATVDAWGPIAQAAAEPSPRPALLRIPRRRPGPRSNHYDHLDLGSVKALHARFGHALAWYVPLGLRPWFKSRGITNVTELDWWQEAAHGGSGVRVALTPAQHWSIRTPWSKKQSLWGGWAVLGPRLRFWFTGDTGYCNVFPEIGERLGPFDLSLIPTGAYEPRWFMKPQHTDPGEAVAIHQEVRSMRSVACHLATFSLTDEPMDEPVRRLPEVREWAWRLAPGGGACCCCCL